MSPKIASVLVVFFAASAAFAEVTVTPSPAHGGQGITIRVANTFGAQAGVHSATINQVGSTFTIQQNVAIACQLPSNPVVASQFQVGPLAPGSYTVTANIAFLPTQGCGVNLPITQSASFAVLTEVPSLNSGGVVLLLVLLGIAGFMKVR